MKDLKDAIAIVAGGTGNVGEGVVRYLLQKGATVIVPFREAQNAERLKTYAGNAGQGKLECIPGFMDDNDSAEHVRDQVLAGYDRIDMAIASLGGWFQDRKLHNLSYGDWNRVMMNNLHSHFIFARTFLSVLHQQKSGMYVNLNGSSSEEVMPDAGIISVIGAALQMMTRVFASEAAGTNVRVYSVALFTPVITRTLEGPVEPDWISAEQTGEYIGKLYTSEANNLDEPVHKLYSAEQI